MYRVDLFTGDQELIGSLGGDAGSGFGISGLASAPAAECFADLDGDGRVGVIDLLIVIFAWGEQGGFADLDGNGIVNVHDLIALLDAWGPCEKGTP